VPSFLPDGRHFVYVSGESSGDVFVGSLDGQTGVEPKEPLLRADGAALYAPGPRADDDGYLLFRREDSLVAQRFDGRRLRLMGDAVPLIDHVGGFLALPFYSASDNGVLVLHPGPNAPRLQLTWVNRTGQTVGKLETEPASYGILRISPDGSRVAMSIVDWTRVKSDIWVADAARGLAARLTFGDGFSTAPVWSPDSRRIAFIVTGESRIRLMERAADGSGDERKLVEFSQVVTSGTSSWSPDGRALLYDRTQTPEQPKRDIMMLPMEGAARQRHFLRLRPTSRTVSFRQTAGGSPTGPTRRARLKSTSGRFPPRPAASGSSREAEARRPCGAATARNCSTSGAIAP